MSSGLGNNNEGQCQYFVMRKKRFCRMTVRPGRTHCGEHDPQLRTEDGQDDSRVPCPYDPKHTCYASKLQKHLRICNAAPAPAPPYIVPNINAPPPGAPPSPRRPLAHTPQETLERVLHKVNALYEEHLAGHLTALPPPPIHAVVQPDFAEPARTEASRRHMRQASALLTLAERRGLVRDGTCYAELGAGKGQLSSYACRAWCAPPSGSRVLLLDRAALRHKRDTKLRACLRVRADLAHVRLARLPAARAAALVALAKHLCGVATDYALRCVTEAGILPRTRGVLLAACCHHRCEPHAYVGAKYLQELGIDSEELEVILGVVSWATCGDGRSRDRRRNDGSGPKDQHYDDETESKDCEESNANEQKRDEESDSKDQHCRSESASKQCEQHSNANGEQKSGVENQKCENELTSKDYLLEVHSDHTDELKLDAKHCNSNAKGQNESVVNQNANEPCESEVRETQSGIRETQSESALNQSPADRQPNNEDAPYYDSRRLGLSLGERAAAGRRAKALLDYGRVLFLRERGFEAGLCQYVPAHVSPENLCIVATKL